MDYCAVGSAKDLINSTLEPLSQDETAQICKGMTAGLSYLHHHGIIHLDVKAANVLLMEDGSIKLGN